MTSQYDPQLAILLAGLCEQTYIQYQNGPPPNNNGKIRHITLVRLETAGGLDEPLQRSAVEAGD